MQAAGQANPAAHATPLFSAAGGAGASSAIHVAVHIRRGDMVYRNFNNQLSPDAYYANAMWHVLGLLAATHAAGAPAPAVCFHVFSQPPPKRSWTGRAKVPLDASRHGAAYVDELGCAADLRAQLATLVSAEAAAGGKTPQWELRMHLDADPVVSVLHMSRAHVLIASDSSFSLIAAVLSRGLVLARDGWRRFANEARAGMLHAMPIRDDGGFDCGRAAKLWAAAARSGPTLE